MTSRRQPVIALRTGALLPLVLAVMAGLMGMHGLGPVSVLQPRHAMPMVMHDGDAQTASPLCDHHGGGSGVHQDAACSTNVVNGGPVLSLPATGHAVAPAAEPKVTRPFAATAMGRAPPSLAQLQLLRI